MNQIMTALGVVLILHISSTNGLNLPVLSEQLDEQESHRLGNPHDINLVLKQTRDNVGPQSRRVSDIQDFNSVLRSGLDNVEAVHKVHDQVHSEVLRRLSRPEDLILRGGHDSAQQSADGLEDVVNRVNLIQGVIPELNSSRKRKRYVQKATDSKDVYEAKYNRKNSTYQRNSPVYLKRSPKGVDKNLLNLQENEDSIEEVTEAKSKKRNGHKRHRDENVTSEEEISSPQGNKKGLKKLKLSTSNVSYAPRIIPGGLKKGYLSKAKNMIPANNKEGVSKSTVKKIARRHRKKSKSNGRRNMEDVTVSTGVKLDSDATVAAKSFNSEKLGNVSTTSQVKPNNSATNALLNINSSSKIDEIGLLSEVKSNVSQVTVLVQANGNHNVVTAVPVVKSNVSVANVSVKPESIKLGNFNATPGINFNSSVANAAVNLEDDVNASSGVNSTTLVAHPAISSSAMPMRREGQQYKIKVK